MGVSTQKQTLRKTRNIQEKLKMPLNRAIGLLATLRRLYGRCVLQQGTPAAYASFWRDSSRISAVALRMV